MSDFAEFHDELRSVARRVLSQRSATSGAGDPSGIGWPVLAESGWLGLEIPEHLDGAGGTFAETAVVLHEMGRAAASSSFVGSAVLGVGALNLTQPSATRDELLREMASGGVRLAVALEAALGQSQAGFRLARNGTRTTVAGRCAFVLDAPGADRLLLTALESPDRPVLVAVDSSAVGLDITRQSVVDGTREFAEVTANEVVVADEAVLDVRDVPGGAVELLFNRGAVAVASDSLGLAESMLDATVAYAGARKQFGRAIGSFQAVKHACADMFVAVSVSRELLAAAIAQICVPTADRAASTSMAKSYICDSAIEIVGKAMQLHGGIGYTWESGIHVFLKRAILNRALFGDPISHRRRLAHRYREPHWASR